MLDILSPMDDGALLTVLIKLALPAPIPSTTFVIAPTSDEPTFPAPLKTPVTVSLIALHVFETVVPTRVKTPLTLSVIDVITLNGHMFIHQV
jgi:hypothetical protein